MKKIFFFLLPLFALTKFTYPQKDTLTGEAAQKILSEIKIDTSRFLNSVSADACKCIDSIALNNKTSKEISADIFTCIDKQVSVYQLLIKVYQSMLGEDKNNNISLNTNKNSQEYQKYYFEIERWLTDSCASLKNAINSDNGESEFSKSKDEKALKLYYKGTDILNGENFKDALPWFEKAVKQDEKFAFAWDNIGVCRRKLGDLDGALEAYTKSLQLDPKGKLPLQNIPVVYEYKKDYDKALEAYKNLYKIYPYDPEAYYGAGRMYELKGDVEKALDNMCKAYNAYVEINSPYRVDAENNISIYFKKMKVAGNEELFYKILKENKLNPSTK